MKTEEKRAKVEFYSMQTQFVQSVISLLLKDLFREKSKTLEHVQLTH